MPITAYRICRLEDFAFFARAREHGAWAPNQMDEKYLMTKDQMT
jgi:hypothetical protein